MKKKTKKTSTKSSGAVNSLPKRPIIEYSKKGYKPNANANKMD